MKTVYFEEKYGVDITDFKSTVEIDEFLEKRLGRKLEVKRCDIFPIKHADIDNIDKLLDEQLGVMEVRD
jgi:hypothetical protein